MDAIDIVSNNCGVSRRFTAYIFEITDTEQWETEAKVIEEMEKRIEFLVFAVRVFPLLSSYQHDEEVLLLQRRTGMPLHIVAVALAAERRGATRMTRMEMVDFLYGVMFDLDKLIDMWLP